MLFLELPSELVLACLAYLPYHDLSSCINAGNRLLLSTILESPVTLYNAEQERAGVDENPFHPDTTRSSIAERRDALRKREDNWLYLSPQTLTCPSIDFVASRGVYWIAGDYWIIGDALDPGSLRPMALKFLRTGPRREDEPEWRTAEARWRRVVDFVAAPEELDLVAMITYGVVENTPPTCSIDIHLLSFSSMSTPHPLAASPIIHIHDISLLDGAPSITIDISGRILAFSMLYPGAADLHKDGLYLYDWQSGLPLANPIPIQSNGPIGLTFITPRYLLLSNAASFSLDILDVMVSPPRLTHSFKLPPLKPNHHVTSVQFRTLPNPSWAPAAHRFARSHTRFLPRPARALVQCAFNTEENYLPTLHVFVLRRACLIDLISPHEEFIEVNWPDWGPTCTRFLDARNMTLHPCTTLTGERLVSLETLPSLNFGKYIRVFNFNAGSVRVVKKRIGRAMGDPDVVQDDGDGPTLYTEYATVRVVDADAPRDPAAPQPLIITDPAPQDENDMDVDDAQGELDLLFPSLAVFADPSSVVSDIPYVESTARAECDYSAVEINHEAIVGTRFGPLLTLSIDAVDVLHFG
ncbi:F-box domain-containing protein [Mycena indigotica]|uniref:F-box domain-containing protein n=1 Tax=Mycena indigotica TaxID=2126181 RepID=A0A8H6W9D4_9AGAR|nr:F-box domain-containing protein [Mycena indigotica]KAF7304014.1 F-box domain-containing protein [Mycena indigotica]